MGGAAGLGLVAYLPSEWRHLPRCQEPRFFGVGCLRPCTRSGSEGLLLRKMGKVQGGGRTDRKRESLKVMQLIEHQQPQIRLCPFVSFSQCVDGKVTRLKAPGAPVGGARQWGEIPPECRPRAPAVPARRENSQLERREKLEQAVAWHLHKGWGPKLPPLMTGAGVPRGEAGGIVG